MKIFETVEQHMLTKFLTLCKAELKLSTFPEIEFIDDQPTVGSPSFGLFDGTIKIVAKDRHQMDVLRTLAHELTHWKQRNDNKEMDGSDGSDIEDEANAVAGVILRKFGKQYPEYFIDAMYSNQNK